MTTDNEQPALDFHVPTPVSDDERIAREEIERFYVDRLRAAEEAYVKAGDALAAASRQHEAWCTTGQIAPVYSAPSQHRDELTIAAIVDDALNRHLSAMQDLIRPATQASSNTAAWTALRRYATSQEGAAAHAAATELGHRAKALCRWLMEQGHDLGPRSAVLNEIDDKPRSNAAIQRRMK